MRISPGDFLIVMAHYLPEGRKCFRYDSERLNRFLYAQKQQHPETSGLWPTSKELSQAVSNMFSCNLIIVGSNTPWNYNFGPECERAYQSFVKPRIPKKDYQILEQ